MWYMSHSIRGKYGKDATAAQMQKNCERIIVIGNVLRATFPSQEFYIPAEHEDFVLTAYNKGYMTEEQILNVDCCIINKCQGVIVYVPEDDELQGGRKIEYDHAVLKGIPVCIYAKVEQVVKWLTHYLLRA